MNKRFNIATASLALLSLFSSGAAFAQTGAEFFAGKTVNYIVATDPGGGYDTNGRLVAEFMQKHLPGSTFVVRNMPGAGHMIGANYIHASEPDGLTIGTFNTGLIYSQLLGNESLRFDLRDLSWVGSVASDPSAIQVGVNSGIETWDDLLNLKEPVRFSGGGVGSASVMETKLLIDALGLKIDLVTGYNGDDKVMAIRRGEVAGLVNPLSSTQVSVREGHGRILLQFGGDRTDIPQARDLITDPVALQAVDLIEVSGTISRLTAAPPGVPADRLEALQEAYRAATSDPEFLARAESMGLPVRPRVGDEIGNAIVQVLDQPPAVIEMLKKAAAN
jgi:tripartite-type tricarboxylate transporter receptor subunit TctC